MVVVLAGVEAEAVGGGGAAGVVVGLWWRWIFGNSNAYMLYFSEAMMWCCDWCDGCGGGGEDCSLVCYGGIVVVVSSLWDYIAEEHIDDDKT